MEKNEEIESLKLQVSDWENEITSRDKKFSELEIEIGEATDKFISDYIEKEIVFLLNHVIKPSIVTEDNLGELRKDVDRVKEEIRNDAKIALKDQQIWWHRSNSIEEYSKENSREKFSLLFQYLFGKLGKVYHKYQFIGNSEDHPPHWKIEKWTSKPGMVDGYYPKNIESEYYPPDRMLLRDGDFKETLDKYSKYVGYLGTLKTSIESAKDKIKELNSEIASSKLIDKWNTMK